MIKINVKDKFTEEELSVLQTVLYYCENLNEIKSLGETINVTKVDYPAPFTFGLDNGKELKYITIGSRKDNLIISFQQNKDVINYTFNPVRKVFVHKEQYNNYEVDDFFDDVNDYNEGEYDGKER